MPQFYVGFVIFSPPVTIREHELRVIEMDYMFRFLFF